MNHFYISFTYVSISFLSFFPSIVKRAWQKEQNKRIFLTDGYEACTHDEMRWNWMSGYNCSETIG